MKRVVGKLRKKHQRQCNMLNGVFVINCLGDVLVHKNLVATIQKWSPEDFFKHGINKVEKHVLPTCTEINSLCYIHARAENIYVVAVTEHNKMSPFLILESLNNFIKVCVDLIGDFTSENILSHVAVVYELAIQMFGLALPNGVTQHAINECKQMGNNESDTGKIFPYVPSNLFGVTPSKEEKYQRDSSASKTPLASGKEKANEIFVDLIEHLVAIVDRNGQVIHTDVKGEMSTKSYLTSVVDLIITLPDKITDGTTNTTGSDNILLTAKRFHSPKHTDDKHKDFPVIKHSASPGLNIIMDYHVESSDLMLPFTMYHNFSKIQKGSFTELTLTCKLFCALPVGISPINWSASLPLPSKLISVSSCSSLKSIEFSQSEDKKLLLMTSPVFPAQSHHSLTINLNLSEVLSYMQFEMPHLAIKFEIPNLCISNMKIQGLKVQNNFSNSTQNVFKWVRCVTHSKDYQFNLKSDWV